ncbi:MAG: hypothetical protein V4671_02515 [Armatimonadota bacterium]
MLPEIFQGTEIRAIVYRRQNSTWSGAFHLSTSVSLDDFLGEPRTACVFVGGDYATEQIAVTASLAAGRHAAAAFNLDL